MKRYWDYTERERAEMTAEQVKGLLAIELMEKGVLRREPPALQPLEDVSMGEKIAYYGTKDHSVLFATMEQAEAFMKLNPLKTEYDWQGAGSEYKYAVPVTDGVCAIYLHDRQSIINGTAALTRNKAIKAANEAVVKEFEQSNKAVNEATADLWNDWDSCRRQAREIAHIMQTFENYKATCDGNEELAVRFLVKVFTKDEIKQAFKWNDKGDPFVQPEAAAAAFTDAG